MKFCNQQSNNYLSKYAICNILYLQVVKQRCNYMIIMTKIKIGYNEFICHTTTSTKNNTKYK